MRTWWRQPFIWEHCHQCPQAVYPEAQPERVTDGATRLGFPNASLFDLAPPVVCQATLVAQSAGGLLPHRFTIASVTLAVRKPDWQTVLCGTFRQLAPSGLAAFPLGSGLLRGVRTFLKDSEEPLRLPTLPSKNGSNHSKIQNFTICTHCQFLNLLDIEFYHNSRKCIVYQDCYEFQ